MTRFQFEEDLLSEQSQHVRLFRSPRIRWTLAAVDRAVAGEQLEGRERLAVFQNLLVDIVSYLEQQEGFRTSFGERRRARAENYFTDEAIVQPSSDVRILHQLRGRVRLGISRLHGDSAYASHLQSLLQTLPQVENVRMNVGAACVVVECSLDVPQAECTKAIVAAIESDLDACSGADVILHLQRSV